MITIKATSMKDQAIIQFCDDGLGISDNEINRIWDRLYRGDRSRTKQGLGLGLNYVKAVVEAHDGTVTVTSKIKEGSCFEVRLPLINSIFTGEVKITN
jgi:signal transduction histidine kinase